MAGVHRLPADPVRAVRKELGRARQALNPPVDVHAVRRTLKRARAELRLCRAGPAVSADCAKTVRRDLRDVGRSLAVVRDRQVAVEVLGPGPWDSALRAPGPTALPPPRVLEQARTTLEESRLVLGPHRDEVPAKRAVGQLARSYARLRRAYRVARHRPTAAALHTLRKRAKDLRHQLEWLEPVWPSVLGAWIDELHQLTDALGHQQDVVVARRAAGTVREPELRGRLSARLRELRREKVERRDDALFLCARLMAESPRPFAKRLQSVLEVVSRPSGKSRLP